MSYTKEQLDTLTGSELLDLKDGPIEGFVKANWKSVWMQAVEYWNEDGGWWYDVVIEGFQGWHQRSDLVIYMDLRFTYIDSRDMSWDDLAEENYELGKYS